MTWEEVLAPLLTAMGPVGITMTYMLIVQALPLLGSVNWLVRLHEKSYPSDHKDQDLSRCQKCAKATGDNGRDFPGEGRKWG